MKHKNYIKNPVKISTLLPKVFKTIRKKNDGLLLEIKLNWEKIVGPELYVNCFVSSLKKVNKKTVLIVVSEKRSVHELSYSSNDIKKNVNKFFQADVVNEIKFKKSFQN
tara:strand:- start:55 stop:381 length:327 start_codon:yes stop_codon:yes gene_type:complete